MEYNIEFKRELLDKLEESKDWLKHFDSFSDFMGWVVLSAFSDPRSDLIKRMALLNGELQLARERLAALEEERNRLVLEIEEISAIRSQTHKVLLEKFKEAPK